VTFILNIPETAHLFMICPPSVCEPLCFALHTIPFPLLHRQLKLNFHSFQGATVFLLVLFFIFVLTVASYQPVLAISQILSLRLSFPSPPCFPQSRRWSFVRSPCWPRLWSVFTAACPHCRQLIKFSIYEMFFFPSLVFLLRKERSFSIAFLFIRHAGPLFYLGEFTTALQSKSPRPGLVPSL